MSKVGFPIRRSWDHRLFAPSPSLSQRTTSFIASYRQGIHQMPLSHLIALISNAHHALTSNTFPSAKKVCHQPTHFMSSADALRAIRTKQCVRILFQKDLVFSGAHHKPPNKTKKSIRLNPNIPLTREICADSAGCAPQALVPLYNVM